VAVERTRLDEMVARRGLAATKSAARSLIMAGQVLVDGQVCDKAGTQVGAGSVIVVKEQPRFVSRAGEKLAHALELFSLDVRGRDALDIGASTGGFVDCLLQNGAERVIALDVGRGQLAGKLRNDPRVFIMEKVNARRLQPEMLPFTPDFLTMDVSFISITKVLPAVAACMTSRWEGVLLIKPQFEAGREQVGRGGIVRDGAVHLEVLRRLARFVYEDCGLSLGGIGDSGLPGTDGNVEYVFYITDAGATGLRLDTLEALTAGVVERAMGPLHVDEV
jgi:23S rRNA (cytidine1920-2'-O)/16S rRNA (cytidine1409-2'-O)-methyltransferase